MTPRGYYLLLFGLIAVFFVVEVTSLGSGSLPPPPSLILVLLFGLGIAGLLLVNSMLKRR